VPTQTVYRWKRCAYALKLFGGIRRRMEENGARRDVEIAGFKIEPIRNGAKPY